MKRMYTRNVYWDVLQEFDLTPSEGMLMFLVDSLSVKEGYCYASKSYLAEVMNVSIPTVYALIKRLISKGLLEKRRPIGHKVSLLTPTELWKLSIDEINKELTSKKNEQ